jgi:hypothetical protein
MKHDQYAVMGRAALLPGMIHMLELMERKIAELKEDLAEMQQQGESESKPKRKKPAPGKYSEANRAEWEATKNWRQNQANAVPAPAAAPRAINGSGGLVSASARNYWANMTPEQRSAEMLRRHAVAAARRKRQVKSNASKNRWATMPKKKKAEHIAAMNAARLAKMAAGKSAEGKA